MIGPLLAVTERIRQRSRASGEFADSEMGVAGAGAALRIGRKLAEKIVKHQEGGGKMDSSLKIPFRRYDLRRSVLIRVLRRDAPMSADGGR
jgi:hypothetical protein